jgi:ZIP family zinc transporter
VHRKIFVAAAISLHNIPEGIACATAIFNAGGTRKWACFIATMSGMVEPVFAVLSVVMLGPWLTIRLIDLSLVSVAGVMITVSVRELIPQAVDGSARHAVAGIVSGFVLVQAGLAMLNTADF